MPFFGVMNCVWTCDKMISKRANERNAEEALDNFVGS
jgi:hypothetical protein